MKKRIVMAALHILACGLSTGAAAQQTDSQMQQAIILRKVLEKNHFSPVSIEDTFSKNVYAVFLDCLDPHKLYLTRTEIDRLDSFQLKIDDELNGVSWKFLPLASQLYKERLLHTKKIISDILGKPFDFTRKEVITLSTKPSSSFAANEERLRERWKVWLKYKTLKYLAASSDSSTDPKSCLSGEPQAREKTLVNELRTINRILDNPGGFDKYMISVFLNSVTSCYDPHSLFLDQTDMENFESAVSAEGFSFGLYVEDTDNGEVKITRLVPGGPAWRSNEVHKGDIITGLRWKGKEAIEMTGADAEEIYEILASSNTIPLELTIRKPNGSVKTISLTKEKIREEENIVRSYILEGEKKIGYISLPGFYSEWENSSGLGCANDVAKEIIKLKKENIEGLILDLRYNGGGSLLEGANLAGIFIDEGPLFILKDREGKPAVMKDLNRGTVYDGPLVVMVNGQSASAAEVVASTLQDYNRAVIVGNPTFGKATGQVMMPLDSTITADDTGIGDMNSPYGYATVTLRKLYRITGKSAQLNGVIPDVILPDPFDELEFRERSYPHPLPSDSVVKKVYYYPLPPLPLIQLKENSRERLASDNRFRNVTALADSLAERLKAESFEVWLDLESYRKKESLDCLKEQQLEEAEQVPTSAFTAHNPAYDNNIISIDSYSKELNETLVQNIQTDMYLAESFYIISDLITLSR